MTPEYGELVEELLRKRFFGKYRGTVEDNNDTLRLGRLKVKVDGVVDGGGLWALPCVPYAGPNVGFHCLPPTGALVWVEFEGGDPSFPIWTGCFWGDGDLPSEVLTADTRLLRTELSQITIDDTTGETTIKNDNDASIVLSLDVKTEAASATHTVGSSGVVSESSPGKVEVGMSGVTINNGAFKVS
jgi:uncharacterized protein involved in type VI secretion and phage assembly